MKKLFLITVALFASISSFAQFGITGGLTSSATNLSAAYAELTTKTINQFHVGVTYKFSLGKIIAIQPALIYNIKGAKLSEISLGSLSDAVDAKFKTGFLELPVQVQVGASLGKIVRLYGIAEPFLGYAISNTVKGDDSGEFSASWEYVKNRMEYGVALGAGIEFIKHIQINLRYFWNFGSIYNWEGVAATTASIKSSSPNGISLSAAFLF